MTARRTADTTTARDRSVTRTHVLPQWGGWPLSRVDEMAVQKWITDLAGRRSHAVASKCLQLTSGVLRSTVRNRLIAVNPCEGVRIPPARKRDTDDLIISRAELRDVLLPVVPVHRQPWQCQHPNASPSFARSHIPGQFQHRGPFVAL